MTIGEALKRFRMSLGLSQKRFAESIGIACNSYQIWEYDKSAPSVKALMKIADTYNVSVDYLLGRSDIPNPTNFDERDVLAAISFRDMWQKAMQMLPQPNNAGQVPAQ